MKKLATLLGVCILMITAAVPVVGEGIYVSSESGDKIRILEDAVISEPIGGNVVLVIGNAEVNSQVNGHVITVFGDATINSRVSGQVVSIFGNTVLTDYAEIMGDVISIGSISKSGGTVINGQEVRILGESMNLDIGAFSYLQLVVMILFSLAVLIIGMLAMLISKKKYNRISKNIEKNVGRKLTLGILAFVGASSLLVILLLTLIAPLFYIILLIMSSIPAFIYLGRIILKTFSQKNSIFAEFITGLISVMLVKLIIILLIPERAILIGIIITGALNFFIYSIGMGILMEQRYLKNNHAELGGSRKQPERADLKDAEVENQTDTKSGPQDSNTEPGVNAESQNSNTVFEEGQRRTSE